MNKHSSIRANISRVQVMFRVFCALLGLSWLVATAGCVAVPYGSADKQIARQDLGKIEVGKTSRSEAVRLLGDRRFLEHDRFMVGYAEQDAFNVLFILGYGSGVIRSGQGFIYHLEFDEHDVVQHFDFAIYERTEYGLKYLESKHTIEVTSVQAAPMIKGEKGLWFGKEFRDVSVSPDGELVAAVELDRDVDLVRRDTKQVVELAALEGADYVGFSRDGRTLIGAGKTVKVVDVDTLKETHHFTGHEDAKVTALSVARKGPVVATGDNYGRIKIWNTANGDEIRTIEQSSGVASMAFSSASNLVISFQSPTALVSGFTLGGPAYERWQVNLWRADSGVRLRGRERIGVSALAFSSDGQTVALHRGSHVELWRVSPTDGFKALDDVFLLHSAVMQSRSVSPPTLSFSPDGRYVAVAGIFAIIYDRKSRSIVWRSPTSVFTRKVEFSPDGRHFYTAADGIFEWELGRQ